MSAEQNKALARRVYEIVSTGDFGRAEEKDKVSPLRIKECEDGPCSRIVAVLARASYRMMPVGELAKRPVSG